MDQEIVDLPDWLQGKFIVLVGLMGAGKTKLGRIIASSFGLPFLDADKEIELAAGCSIQEIFDRFGEEYFRDGERRVIQRILCEAPAVLSTGGGAFMNEETQAEISKHGVAVWLRADLDLLVRRTERRSGRPLLNKGNGREILAGLIDERYPVYAKADFAVDVSDEPAPETAKRIMRELKNHPPANIPKEPNP
ncbi:MAG: shikimate kinase [Rhodospirillales bacterium]|nr:shikimate kinase [Rhodospirillales bacterium]